MMTWKVVRCDGVLVCFGPNDENYDPVFPPGAEVVIEMECPDIVTAVASVTPWQIRKALNQTGLRAAVESAVSAADQTTKDAWEFAQEFRRDNPLIAAVAAGLGKTSAEIDALFELAGSL